MPLREAMLGNLVVNEREGYRLRCGSDSVLQAQAMVLFFIIRSSQIYFCPLQNKNMINTKLPSPTMPLVEKFNNMRPAYISTSNGVAATPS
jgi:hypothetical protein